MNAEQTHFDGIILLGPFGSGKTFLGHRLNEAGVAKYIEMEPIIYDLFSYEGVFDTKGATQYLRQSYYEQLKADHLVVFESTGVVQRPLLLELCQSFHIGLIRVGTPKEVCLIRVKQRNATAKRPINIGTTKEFYDMWTNDIAPTYDFTLTIDGSNSQQALQEIVILING